MHGTMTSPRILQVVFSTVIWALLSRCELVTDGGVKIPLIPVPRGQQTGIIPLAGDTSLTNSNDFAYLVGVNIGGQDLLVLLDTGSSDLWVVSSDCTAQDCQGVPKYTQTPTLTSSNNSFDLEYLSGSVTGSIGSETVTLGSYEISSQIFGENCVVILFGLEPNLLAPSVTHTAFANSTSKLGLAGIGNSGIMGLSFPAEAAIPDTCGRTILENIFAAVNESSRFIAYHLGRDHSSSSFTIGQLDPDFANSTSDMTLSSVVPDGTGYNYWKIPLQSLTINSTAFKLSRSRVAGVSTPIAVLDTGTTLILGPSADVERFWASVGGARNSNAGWQVRCDRAIIVGFVLGEGDSRKEYIIDPADLSWEASGQTDGWCMGGIQANDGVYSGDWLLGDSFLRNVYVTHHAATSDQPPTIGLRGLTDADSSMAQFRLNRGEDTTPPADVLSKPHEGHAITSADICGIAVAGGFVVGILLPFLACIIRPRRGKRHVY
ncbi:acid protease [Amylocystis lapponica]|nr:acid protease [Amylocystis lapponica]